MAAPNDGQAGRATAQGLNALDTLRNLIASNSNPQLNAQLDAIKADYQVRGCCAALLAPALAAYPHAQMYAHVFDVARCAYRPMVTSSGASRG